MQLRLWSGLAVVHGLPPCRHRFLGAGVHRPKVSEPSPSLGAARNRAQAQADQCRSGRPVPKRTGALARGARAAHAGYAARGGDAFRVQALREPHVRGRRDGAQVQDRPRARGAVELPGRLRRFRAAHGRRGLGVRLARGRDGRRAAGARRGGRRRRRRAARCGRGHREHCRCSGWSTSSASATPPPPTGRQASAAKEEAASRFGAAGAAAAREACGRGCACRCRGPGRRESAACR